MPLGEEGGRGDDLVCIVGSDERVSALFVWVLWGGGGSGSGSGRAFVLCLLLR